MKLFLFYMLIACLIVSCGETPPKTIENVVKENGNKLYYGLIGKDSIFAYTIKNENGMRAVITNYGGTLLELWTPDLNGTSGNIILGFDSLAGYLQKGNPYFGALVGRYANRISHAAFSLDGNRYTLAPNDFGNTLHGGIKGFDKVIWTVNQVNDSSLALSYLSRDGEEGFPGNLNVKVVYTMTTMEKHLKGLKIDYTALTDKKTPLNLTNHAYFNLSAGRDSTILGEDLTIHAARYTPVNDSLIPTGVLAVVKNTAFDFSKFKKIGKDIDKVKGGYDHNFVIDRKDSGLVLAAELHDPVSHRWLWVMTTQPGIQFYTGNFLNGTLQGRNGKFIVQHGALCLETQHFPDSPNQPAFPGTILEPGQTFHETTIFGLGLYEPSVQ